MPSQAAGITYTARADSVCPRCRALFAAGDLCPTDSTPLVPNRGDTVLHGRYRLQKLLGVGGSEGAVWEAVQEPLGRRVAVKFGPRGQGIDRQRFDRGARIMGDLSHPCIAVVHDFGVAEDEHPFIVMERLMGVPLSRLLRKRGRLEPRRAIQLMITLLDALAYMHQRGVVHRDIKPQNVHVSAGRSGALEIKLLDFGLARSIRPAEDGTRGRGGRIQAITTPHRICGTPEYMAPEQAAGAPIDQRADLYAVAISLFKMVTGRLPFDADSPRSIYAAKFDRAPMSLHEAAPDVELPAGLQEVLTRALARDPQHRYATADAMRDALMLC